MSERQRHKIEERAYELFMARDYKHGNDLDDWLTAEKEVLGSPGSKNKGKKRRTKK